MIALIDYGMGNIFSVKKALELCGAGVLVTNNPADILSCEKIVLPGVGAFDDAMFELEKQGLVPVIKNEVKSKKPFLGICLGMHLLFENSEEAKIRKGLGILKGRVRKFLKGSQKVPHIGWNQVNLNNSGPMADGRWPMQCPLLKNIKDGSYVYFCHSYYVEPDDKSIVALTCDYGVDFTAGVWQGNVYGVQFHPEKSQEVGLKILENFVNLC
ncbi:MAG: imidazole glycerol phosphate synthase subunit HisH [Candidatus Omnitrophica bacterium CG08_land_8_20_14_0_20_41_16]|uniref:Imidazole glycerol phosphate synthase subunit HisH n=1 Tax=Candidatus Sherwoodlollariibacterium unditelluris TaxID=1974757 RepID=A0A2G9YK00_9BACT|nr:MAG: imidazole glycerol phosphate synthase subunit HisH [Candidatus Omnitrophica bacterium CG23_combo_of_CG06-09_8_20_14_all_41_10]PIS33657.1 MAG: imidazole glycerol phosphate synthase subunit HisH [Candidatus Omnitrophica bacterium CG08_land_8_20_14_0_20_41_16]